MDIHKPKAAHSWREFAVEIGTIICGILIALSLEQGLEWLHWRHAVEAAHAGLETDAKIAVVESGRREAQAPCLAREFDWLRTLIERASETGRMEAVTGVNEPPREPWAVNSYDAIVSGGVLPHMSVEERVTATGMDHWGHYLHGNMDEEVRAWSVLRTLEGPGRRVTDVELANLRTALSTATYQENLMRQGSWLFTSRIVQGHILTANEVAEAWRKGMDDGRTNYACAAGTASLTNLARQRQALTNPLPPPPAPRPPWL